MGRTMAALIQPRSRLHPSAQKACQSPRGALFNQTAVQAGITRPAGRIHKMNIRQPVPTPTLIGDSYRQGWLRHQYNTSAAGIKQGGSGCGTSGPHRIPPKGGKKIMLCGGCGVVGPSIPGGTTCGCGEGDCDDCSLCGVAYNRGNGSQDTHQIFKDTVKGNRGAFACGGTNKAVGVYGSGTVVTREYTARPPLPGMVAPSVPGTPLFVVQPPPAVKTITVPARKSYAYSTSELIKKTNIGYDANLAIRSCGTRSCGLDGDCLCNCSLCCQANIVCGIRSYWAELDGVCPGGMTGIGTSCRTGSSTACGVGSGPCKCQNWTYKRKNNIYAANGGVDASLLTARMTRVARVADECNTEECERVERNKTPLAADPAACVHSGLLPGTLGQQRRIPQELHQPRRPRPGQS